MKSVLRGKWMLAVAAVLAGMCNLSRAGALDERVPAEAMVYVGWAGADALAPQYAISNIKGIIDASVIKDFVNTQLPKLIDQAAQGNPNAPKMIAKLQTTLTVFWKHPSAFYFCPLDFTNPQMPGGRFGVICDAGADSKALFDQLTEHLAQVPPNPDLPIHLLQDGNVIIVTFGKADSADDLKKGGGLAAVPAYKAAMEKAKSTSPAIAVYADVSKTVGMINDALAKVPAPPEAKEKVPLVIDSLGLNSMTQIAYTGGFEGKGWSDHTYMGISGPKKGVLALLDMGALSDGVLAVVPKEAAAFAAWKLDLRKVFTETRTAVGKIDAGAQRDVDAGIAEAGKELGLEIERDLLTPLGDEWVLYRAPLSDEGGNSIALVHTLKDGDAFAKSLAKIEAVYNANPGVPVKVEKIKAAKVDASTLSLGIVSVAWAVNNGKLYVSTLGGLGGAIKQVENKSPSIAESDLYKAARAALPANAKPMMLSYTNPAKVYPELRRQVVSYLPIVRRAGFDIPMEILPDSDDVTKFMTPGASMMWWEADGIHGTGNSAFPGAEMLGGQQAGPGAVAVLAVGGAVALPALSRSRQMATATVDASSLRSIAQSSLVYAADHNDQMPEDIARLVADGMISTRQLVSRRSGTEALVMTAELEKLAKEDFAKFSQQVALHNDFVYLGKGTKSQLDAGLIVAYEKPHPRTTDGINVVFQDGHAEFVPWPRVAGAFAATSDALQKKGLPTVDVQAMMKAAGVGPQGPGGGGLP